MPKTPQIIPISDLRQNASNSAKGIEASKEPVLITQRGRVAAVMVNMEMYETSQYELDILHLLARGEKEIEAGIGLEIGKVFKEADLFLKSSQL
jgi:PHD/YefM family antitoxin component YafN of YafNO toxin-antitoxin module